jgi:hypothetical protein
MKGWSGVAHLPTYVLDEPARVFAVAGSAFRIGEKRTLNFEPHFQGVTHDPTLARRGMEMERSPSPFPLPRGEGEGKNFPSPSGRGLG